MKGLTRTRPLRQRRLVSRTAPPKRPGVVRRDFHIVTRLPGGPDEWKRWNSYGSPESALAAASNAAQARVIILRTGNTFTVFTRKPVFDA